ncbi:MAG: diguanylate cyclase [Selenomonadaceae bacterium]|nr:diguanylate cyclase [Selenomonadaceae bacterium]
MSKILIVDDEQIMLLLARRILSTKYEVVTASNGAEALEIFAQERPDLVLSDLLMPEMDGYELHKLLQEQSATPVPIMFMTADESDESESKGFELGAADYIRKPLKPDVLLRRVGNIIDNLDKIRGLKTAASTDPLTGLLNKAASQDEIGALAEHSSGALMMVDMDSFKLVNDIYGHAMGDKILVRFAELLKKITRETDLAGRMGGDEFILYLQNVDDEKVLRSRTEFLNRQLVASAKEFMGAEMEIPLGVSVGAVFVPDEGRDFASLYKKADSALYSVKQHGKHGLTVYNAQMHHEHKKISGGGGISQMRMILGERNVDKEAYFVDFDTFKKIYQLLSRMAEHYRKGLTLMQFTLSDSSAAEEVKDVLLRSLRRSDCVSQSGGNKFFVLLMEATEEESDGVRDRIFSRLKPATVEKISYEREGIF